MTLPAATPNHDRCKTTEAALMSARAVVADLTQHEDAEVIAACDTILDHSDRPTERIETRLLRAFIKKEN